MRCRTVALVAGSLSVFSSSLVLAADYQVTVRNLTPGMYYTPFLVAAHAPSLHLYTAGEAASQELQRLAEGGDVMPLATQLTGLGANVDTGDGLLGPGESVSFTVSDAGGNTHLSLAAMILPSNDGFVALNGVALSAVPDGGSQHWTANVYDAGTEANDELIGGGGPGEAGFPAPPPVVMSGTGTGGQGIDAPVEGHVSVHKGLLGDLDTNGGPSDVNAAVHGWQNPGASITVTRLGGGGGGQGSSDGPGSVTDLSAQVYSSSALELFWSPVSAGSASVVAYEIYRDGELVATLDAQSFFDDGLQAGTQYAYRVRAIDAAGEVGSAGEVGVTTNTH